MEALVDSNVKAGRLSFTTELTGAVADADVVFIAVGTPSRRGDGHADLGYVYAAAKEIAESIRGFTAVVTKVIAAAGGDVRGKKIAVLGLTFKPNTDDMRDSPAIAVVQTLQDAGAIVSGYDPEGMENAKQLMDIEFATGPYQAAEGADVAVLVTEWNQFRALDLPRLKSVMKSPVLVDLRNVYRAKEVEAHGFTYSGVGKAD